MTIQAVDRFNCPECFYNPEVCVDFCQKCFNDKDVPHNRQQTSPNQGVYHRHTKFLHIDPKGQHTWVTREITEAANAKYHLLNPNIEDLPHRYYHQLKLPKLASPERQTLQMIHNVFAM